MTQSCEPLSCHTGTSDNGGGVGSNRDVTLVNRGAVEMDWQNERTYESYERSYIKLEKNLPM